MAKQKSRDLTIDPKATDPAGWPGLLWRMIDSKLGVLAVAVAVALVSGAVYFWLNPPRPATDGPAKSEAGDRIKGGIVIQGHAGNDIKAEVTYNELEGKGLEILEKGLPQSEHPVVDLERPISEQIQLFAEDEVSIVGGADLKEVRFGPDWERFDNRRHYVVWTQVGKPFVPEFRRRGDGHGPASIKLQIRYTKYRDKPRDLTHARWSSQGSNVPSAPAAN